MANMGVSRAVVRYLSRRPCDLSATTTTTIKSVVASCVSYSQCSSSPSFRASTACSLHTTSSSFNAPSSCFSSPTFSVQSSLPSSATCGHSQFASQKRFLSESKPLEIGNGIRRGLQRRIRMQERKKFSTDTLSLAYSRPMWTKAKRIILIRHGESTANVDEEVYVTTPDWKIPLTDKGKQQATRAGQQVAELVGNEQMMIYASPYQRTRETLRHIKSCVNEDSIKFIREDPRLAEQQFGNFQDFEQMRHCKQDRSNFGRFFYRFPNGEAGLDVYNRATSFFGSLSRHCESLAEFHGDDAIKDLNIVVVTHGLALRLLLMRYFQVSVSEFEESINPDNGELVVLERRRDEASLNQWFEIDEETQRRLNMTCTPTKQRHNLGLPEFDVEEEV